MCYFIHVARKSTVELYSYVNKTPAPADEKSAALTLQYLEACNKLFENGFLSHEKLFNMDNDILKSISKGYNFFTTWFTELMEKGTFSSVSRYLSLLNLFPFCINVRRS